MNKGQETHNYRIPLLSDVIVKVKPKLYSTYPFMDTLTNYIPDKGILCNSTDNIEDFPDIRKETSIEKIRGIFKKRKSNILRLVSTSGEYRVY